VRLNEATDGRHFIANALKALKTPTEVFGNRCRNSEAILLFQRFAKPVTFLSAKAMSNASCSSGVLGGGLWEPSGVEKVGFPRGELSRNHPQFRP
jgi:hypothetical protein